jgi:transposase InsO family protein
LEGKLENNVYRLDAEANMNHDSLSVALNRKLSWDDAHRRLGHISLTSIKALLKGNLVTGLEIDETAEPSIHCESCIQAKATHKSFPKEAATRASRPGDLIHSDIWGPSRTASPGGSRYFISFTDDHTRRTTIKFIRLKSDGEAELKNYVAWIETQLGRTPKAFRTDNGGEYLGVKPWLESKGIELHPSAPYSPSQNGVSERMNRTLNELMIAMMAEKDLPPTLWAEAIYHAAYIRNQSSTRSLQGMTPMEAWAIVPRPLLKRTK